MLDGISKSETKSRSLPIDETWYTTMHFEERSAYDQSVIVIHPSI